MEGIAGQLAFLVSDATSKSRHRIFPAQTRQARIRRASPTANASAPAFTGLRCMHLTLPEGGGCPVRRHRFLLPILFISAARGGIRVRLRFS